MSNPPAGRRPLIYWCRWQRAVLRLRGRDADALWGELAYDDGRLETFHYHLPTRRLTHGEGATAVTVTLDEMGISSDS